ncbi:hypothetical protein GN958_ATG02249, partial [Phytophthora infestans]
SADKFEQQVGEFKYLACPGERSSLWDYVSKNWKPSKEMWATEHRINRPHFNNNTSNRLSSMSMRECFKATIQDQRRKEDELVTLVLMPGTLRDLTYDDEMNQLLGMTRDWSASVFAPADDFAVDPGSAKSYRINDEDLYVSWSDTSRRRKQLGVQLRILDDHEAPVQTLDDLPHTRSYAAHNSALGYSLDVPLPITTASADVKHMKRMSEQDKYRVVQSALARISTELSELPVDKFEAAIDNLVKWRSRLRLGDVTMETPLSSDDADLSSAPTQVADKNTAEDNEINEEKDAEDEKESEEQQTEDVEVNKKKYVEGVETKYDK